MKKILIFGALGLAIFLGAKALNKPNDSESTDETQSSEIDQILQENEGRLTSDKDGYWFLIKGGKLLLGDEATFHAWVKNNPSMINASPLPVSIWVPYNQSLFGGYFTATT